MPAALSSGPSLDSPPHAGGDDVHALPRRFGPYTLFAPVGRGGMAELFLARAETELGATKLVVVKQILPAFSDDPRFSEMLIHEAKLAAGLSHRHIVQVHDLGRDEGRLYIAMDYVEGFDLNALLRLCTQKGEGLPAEHALGIVADMLEGLDYAHRRCSESGAPLGIVHRDVSPSNVLISYDGEV
ncbi:MAG: serine/threonine protein kinase, partial [Labilithrix sp.]|nr:serine/threonine protein kinase [Labilithrix sp.]